MNNIVESVPVRRGVPHMPAWARALSDMEFTAHLSEWCFLLACVYGVLLTVVLCSPGGQKALGALAAEVVQCRTKKKCQKEAAPERSGARNY